VTMRPGLPDLSLFPRRAWVAVMRRAYSEISPAALDYPDPRGAEPARRAITTYLNRARATVARADRAVFCSGTAQGIGLLCRVLRERGVRRIAVEDPGHADQCTDIRKSGLETPRVPVDEKGLDVERLRSLDAGAVLVTPAHQYPIGAVLAPTLRGGRRLLDGPYAGDERAVRTLRRCHRPRDVRGDHPEGGGLPRRITGPAFRRVARLRQAGRPRRSPGHQQLVTLDARGRLAAPTWTRELNRRARESSRRPRDV
jgi:hypothetical protein